MKLATPALKLMIRRIIDDLKLQLTHVLDVIS
jgi:hypothetical protein